MNTCKFPDCSRPTHVRGQVEHDFCGRTHAEEAAKLGLIPPVKAPHGSCHTCNLRGCEETVAFDEKTRRVHDFW